MGAASAGTEFGEVSDAASQRDELTLQFAATVKPAGRQLPGTLAWGQGVLRWAVEGIASTAHKAIAVTLNAEDSARFMVGTPGDKFVYYRCFCGLDSPLKITRVQDLEKHFTSQPSNAHWKRELKRLVIVL